MYRAPLRASSPTSSSLQYIAITLHLYSTEDIFPYTMRGSITVCPRTAETGIPLTIESPSLCEVFHTLMLHTHALLEL